MTLEQQIVEALSQGNFLTIKQLMTITGGSKPQVSSLVLRMRKAVKKYDFECRTFGRAYEMKITKIHEVKADKRIGKMGDFPENFQRENDHFRMVVWGAA